MPLTAQSVKSAVFSADGRQLFAFGEVYRIRGWDLRAGRTVFDLDSDQPIDAFALTPDGRYVLTAGATSAAKDAVGEIKVWEVATARVVKQWHTHGTSAYGVVCDPGGKWFATGGQDGVLRVWDFPGCQEVRHFGKPAKQRRAGFALLAAVPPGKRFLCASAHGLFLWDVERDQVKSLENSADRHYEVVVDPEGIRVAACLFRRTGGPGPANELPPAPSLINSWLRLWDARTGQVVTDPRWMKGPELKPAKNVANRVALFPGGRYLLTGQGVNSVRFWDVAQRRCLLIREPAERPYVFAISPAGDRLATGHLDGVVRVWGLRLPKGP